MTVSNNPNSYQEVSIIKTRQSAFIVLVRLSSVMEILYIKKT